MDVRLWKKIIQQWITECGFTERNCLNLEQTDLDEFFQNFRKHHKGASKSVLNQQHIIQFLKEHYPKFEPLLNDDDALSFADYVYVYSLLLHFSCVKYPEPYFHEICKRLSEQYQQNIASFFKQLLDCTSINKENLRQAIANIGYNVQTSPNSSNTSSNNSTTTVNGSIESPLRTPIRQITSNNRISPSTPKTFLLEERTRELYQLRALLDTERYEKGLLEVQLKQYEEKIEKLSQDQKRLQQIIQELRNDLFCRNAEENCTNPDEQDLQFKKRVCKEISQKEQEITKITDILNTLKDEKTLLSEKLAFADNNLQICIERINQLQNKVNEQEKELEVKSNTITYLTNSKLELEQFIAETRNDNNNLNSSSEFLDVSFSNITNSSGSPENLASSVVDKKLREKENENYLLQEEINLLRSNYKRLGTEMQEFYSNITQDFNLSLDIQADAESVASKNPEQAFKLVLNCVERIKNHFKAEQSKVQTLTDETRALYNVNAHLNGQLKKFEEEVRLLREMVKTVENRNAELEKAKEELKDHLSQSKLEIDMVSHQKSNVINQLENLAKEYEEHKKVSTTEQKKMDREIREFKEYKEKLVSLTSGYEQYKEACKIEQDKLLAEVKTLRHQAEQHHLNNSKLHTINAQCQEEIESLECKLRDTKEKLLFKSTEYEMDLKSLQDKLNIQAKELSSHKSAETLVKEKYEKLLIEYEDMRTTARETEKHLENMREDISSKEKQMTKLGNEIIESRQNNAELVERINKLMAKYKKEKEKAQHDVAVKEDRIQEVIEEKFELERLLLQTKKEYDSLNFETRQVKSEISSIETAIELLMSLIDKPMTENDLGTCLEHITSKVKELLTSVEESESKFECLTKENAELRSLFEKAEKKLLTSLEDNKNLSSKLDYVSADTNKLLKLSQERILEYERRCDKLTEELARNILDMEKKMKEKDECQQFQIAQLSSNYESNIQVIREELIHERTTKNKECSELNKKLLETVKLKEQLDLEKSEAQFKYSCKLKSFESKMEEMSATNHKLTDEIEHFKQEHNKTVDRLEVLSQSLNETCEQKALLAEELKEKEEQLRKLLEEQESNDKNIIALEEVKSQQIDTIVGLREQLEQLTEEKKRLQNKYAELVTKLECEQKEKATILSSLEKTVDQLQATEENLKKTCNKKNLLQEKEEINNKLVVDTEVKLQIALDHLKLERQDWNTRITELQTKLNNETEKYKTIDISILEILTVLENYRNIEIECEQKQVPNRFNANEVDTNGNLNRLKKTLNEVIYKVGLLESRYEISQKHLDETNDLIKSITADDLKLKAKLTKSEKEINELKILLEKEDKAVEHKLMQDLIRIKCDMRNLEAVNEKLAVENADLQLKWSELEADIIKCHKTTDTLREQNKSLAKDNEHKKTQIEHLRKEQLSLQEQLQEKDEDFVDLTAQCAKLETELEEKVAKLTATENDIRKANVTINETQTKLTKLEDQLKLIQRDLSEQHQKYCKLQEANVEFYRQLEVKSKELESLQFKHDELFLQNKQMNKDIETTVTQLEEISKAKNSLQTKYDSLNTNFKDLNEKFGTNKTKHDSALAEIVNLTVKLSEERTEKRQLADELKVSSRKLQQATDNITELIQQITSVRTEKQAFYEEAQELRKQIIENNKVHTEFEEKLKTVQDNSERFEKQLLQSEKELSALNAQLEKSSMHAEKLNSENEKLRETNENTTKRLEKLALKLGESQAQCSKLERENERISKTVANNTVLSESLQRERDCLQSECKLLKERLTNVERAQETLQSKLEALEKEKLTIEDEKKKLLCSENEAQEKCLRLEKLRETHDDKFKKLTQTLNNYEQDNVRLNLEIGALNKQLVDANTINNRKSDFEKLKNDIHAAVDKVKIFENLNKKLELEMHNLREENTDLNDQISKLTLSLQISETKVENINKEMDQLRADLLIIREEKTQTEEQHLAVITKLQDVESTNKMLLAEREDNEQNCMKLKIELATQNTKAKMLQKQVEDLQASCSETNVTAAELENLRTSLAVAEAVRAKDKETNEKLIEDIKIYQAKYRDLKIRFEELTNTSEYRIKETRLELEGKLEKMKNKMRMHEECGNGTQRLCRKDHFKSCSKFFILLTFGFLLIAIMLGLVTKHYGFDIVLKKNTPLVF